ncbi:hypothetical protein KGF54_001488 [Candida jiufengensis]|uniref:uncharacterized protein n=1 Tax=Candida jiufengensis TaxID=497108 RepID=UPI00222491E7|nr:uncharacterized protein KGF54_001488 [Candida jiufengensis]KAI5954927.1 hypothetical protein KGF54_001488 [Candida jiufengensis]
MTTIPAINHKDSTISPTTSPTSPTSVFESDLPIFATSYPSSTSLNDTKLTNNSIDSSDFKQQTQKSILNTLKFESEAVSNLYNQYQNDEFSINQLNKSLEIMYNCHQFKKGKIILTGIGKSFKLALKLEATLNSLSIHSSVLHPSEALHGDLGMIHNNDILIFISSSGNSDELINILQHIPDHIPILLLTNKSKSILSQNKRISSLIFADLSTTHNELSIHGIPAPTVSYTISLILADSLVLSLSEILESDLTKRKHKFSKKHPGGSIGSSLSMEFSKFKPFNKKEEVDEQQKNYSISSNSTSYDSLSLKKFSTREEDNLSSLELKFNHKSSPTSKKIKIINHEEILNLKEIELLKYILFFDLIKIDDLTIDIESVKLLYKKICCFDDDTKKEETSCENWSKFKWVLLRSFK